MAMALSSISSILFSVFVLLLLSKSEAFLSSHLKRKISTINRGGRYFGLVIPNTFEMNPLLQPPTFLANDHHPYVDISGRRFHIGTVVNRSVIVVMTGLGMTNAGITTQLLLTLFRVKGVVHYGIARNGNSDYHIGDVTIPRQWAHTGLWNWQRYGQGENDELPLEANGDYTREVGYLKFSNYSTPTGGSQNLLNNVWYQPDEFIPVHGTPELREHAFWVNVSDSYYQLSQKIENLELESCLNTSSCLFHKPKVVRVERGCSANVYVDNAAYRNFLHHKFNVTPIDMESARVALVCLSESKPFIIIRALSDLAGGSSEENEAATFTDLAAKNAVIVVATLLKLLP
ncbi:hypothetical protein SUGI_1137430 [Cryptomeria japonica]|uniref:bark storage protein A-like n=1 Tax=Cryptomeria japonica TaxID=3369 RepID=UPI002414B057|nr:bark storage protein A-like [Cryptomeria japonica]GLJ53343.1 hypothetical protein SUGI_1137430 [Cryptomeria japonica]